MNRLMSSIQSLTTTRTPIEVSGIRKLFFSQEMVLFLCIIFLLVFVGLINPRFVSNRNLISLFLGNAYIAVAAIGMSMVIISGNIDISVGSLIGVLNLTIERAPTRPNESAKEDLTTSITKKTTIDKMGRIEPM